MAISANLTKTCYPFSGGIDKLYICDKASVTSMTLTSEQYTAITMASSNVFYSIDFDDDTCSLTWENKHEDGASPSVDAMVEFSIIGLSNTNRTFLAGLRASSYCGVIVIAVDTTGTKWVLGYGERSKKALRFKSGTTTTNKKSGDSQNSVITLSNNTPEEPRVYTGTVPV